MPTLTLSVQLPRRGQQDAGQAEQPSRDGHTDEYRAARMPAVETRPFTVVVTSQNELVHAEVAVERRTHARFPAAEQAELAATGRGYGADPDTAARMTAAVSRDPDTALRVDTP
jgi:hypothetical protein